jgi:flagellar hook-associated protein 1 FlgK
MSLFSALNTASSAIATEQAAITVTGNNIANVGNANYSREVIQTTPGPDTEIQPGMFLGTGVDLTGIQRQVDDALNSRLRSSTSDNSAAQTTSNWVGQLQSTLNALSGNDLSSQMSTFFTSWSNLANNPTDSGLRQIVLQDGQNLAGYVNGLSTQLNTLNATVAAELPQQAQTANSLATDIASLNVQIVQAQGGTAGTANGLLDQRDSDLSKLAQLVNITTADQPDGSVNVYIGTQPLVEGQTNHGLSVQNVANASTGTSTPTLVFNNTGGTVPATSGVLGALSGAESQISTVSTQINTIAKNLISAVNIAHSSGQGTEGFSSVTAATVISDPTVALSNQSSGAAGNVSNGSFVLHVTQADGTTTSTLVPVTEKGAAGDTTLNSLVTSLNAINGVTATVAGGQLTIKSTSPTATISFSQDSSGALAALGINTFFTGTSAGDIAVNSTLTANPDLLAAAQNGEPGDNSNATAISQIESQSLAGLNGQSLTTAYQNLVTQVGNSAATATTNASATQTVVNTLTAQQQALSGVSINEETVNLMQQQQAFQAAARVVSTVQAMYATLINAMGGV